MDERRGRVGRLPKVEELYSTREQTRFRDRTCNRHVCWPDGLGQQHRTETDVLDDRGMEVERVDGPVHAPVAGADNGEVRCDRGWVRSPAATTPGGPPETLVHRSCHGSRPTRPDSGRVVLLVPRRDEPELFNAETEHVGEKPLMVGMRPWWACRLPAADLARTHAHASEPELAGCGVERVGERLLRPVPACETSRFEHPVPRRSCHDASLARLRTLPLITIRLQVL